MTAGTAATGLGLDLGSCKACVAATRRHFSSTCAEGTLSSLSMSGRQPSFGEQRLIPICVHGLRVSSGISTPSPLKACCLPFVGSAFLLDQDCRGLTSPI